MAFIATAAIWLHGQGERPLLSAQSQGGGGGGAALLPTATNLPGNHAAGRFVDILMSPVGLFIGATMLFLLHTTLSSQLVLRLSNWHPTYLNLM